MKPRRFRFEVRQVQRPLLIVLGVWVVLAAGFFFFLLQPKIREYRYLESGSDPQQQALRERTRAVERMEQFVGGLAQAEQDLDTLRREVFSTRRERLDEIHAEVERLCIEHGLDLDKVSYGNELLEEEELDRLVMNVPLEGGYANLRRFLQAVEGSGKFLSIEKVALAEGREGGVMLQLNVTLTTYFDVPDWQREDNRESRRRRARRA